MDEREIAELCTMEPKSTVSTRFGRASGIQQFTAALEVSCAETHSARSEMVTLLRSLADDIEAGLV
jgi:hypothetical protein